MFDHGPFCGATDCSFFLPHGFQIQSGSLACTLSCLHVVIPKVMFGVTPTFSTNQGVHCISMYMALQLDLFDTHACSHQMYLQALVEVWPGPGVKPTIYHAPAQHTKPLSHCDQILKKVNLTSLPPPPSSR